MGLPMGVFVSAFIALSFIAIPEPHLRKAGHEKEKFSHSPWNFRHTVLGVISPEADIIFYKSGPEQGYTLLEAGMFGFYAPEDGHMPCIAVTEAQPATKIVFKIPVKG